MKILDLGNAQARIKAFLLWGVLLFIVEYVTSLIFSSSANGTFIEVAVALLFSVFAGYMTANSLAGKTGDKHSSAGYGMIPPLFAAILGSIVGIVTTSTLHFTFPILPMLAGIIGGYLSQRKF